MNKNSNKKFNLITTKEFKKLLKEKDKKTITRKYYFTYLFLSYCKNKKLINSTKAIEDLQKIKNKSLKNQRFEMLGIENLINLDQKKELSRKIPNLILSNSIEFQKITRDKFKTYKILKNSKEIKNFLPKTRLLSDIKDLDKYKNFIIKPRFGSKGKNINLIKGLSKKDLKKFFKNPKNFIIQEFIEPARINNRFSDLRHILIKENKNFKVVYSFFRLAKNKSSILTNIHQGGVLYKIEKIKNKEFKNIINFSKTIALKIAEKIEKTSKNYATRCSIDFIIDKNLKLYFIEINSYFGWKFMKNKDCNKKRILRILASRCPAAEVAPDVESRSLKS